MDWGPEPIVAVDFTSGGAPIGLTITEYRECSAATDRGEGWSWAKRAIRMALARWAVPNAKIEIGWVRKAGEGLYRDVYWANVEIRPDPDGLTGDYTAAIPRRDAPSQIGVRARREAELLPVLAGARLPFRVPKRAVVVQVEQRPILVRDALSGIPLDMRASRQGSVRPWQVIGEMAAAVHRIDTGELPSSLSGYPTQRAHALSRIAAFDELPSPLRQNARAWALGNLPDEAPSVLLHGDLLGQNILLGLDEPPALIDWEYATKGDPACDLAIVTRAARKPFKLADGFEKFLAAYTDAGGVGVAPTHVRLHELCLLADWYRDAIEGAGPEPPEQLLIRFDNALRRLTARYPLP